MTDQIEVHVTPMVMVVTTDGDRTVAFSDIAQEGDDAATISDADLKARAARWFDLPAGSLNGHTVERRTTGNIIIMPRPTYGKWSWEEDEDVKRFNRAFSLYQALIVAYIVGICALMAGGAFVVCKIMVHFGIF